MKVSSALLRASLIAVVISLLAFLVGLVCLLVSGPDGSTQIVGSLLVAFGLIAACAFAALAILIWLVSALMAVLSDPSRRKAP